MTIVKNTSDAISLESAVKTLSSLASLKLVGQKAVSSEKGKVVRLVSTLRKVLVLLSDAITQYHPEEHSLKERKKALEGFFSVMRLTKKAVHNVHKYIDPAEKKQFKKLSNLYAKKIAPLLTLYKVHTLPVKQLFFKEVARSMGFFEGKIAQKLAFPMESITNDRDYELLYLKKADGKPYCSKKVIKNIRLASDIEAARLQNKQDQVEDEFERTKREQEVHDVYLLLYQLHNDIDQFFHQASKGYEQPLLRQLYSACIALMMASVQGIHIHAQKGKDVDGYIQDFKDFILKFYKNKNLTALLSQPLHNKDSWEYALIKLSEHLAELLSQGLPLAEKAYEAFSSVFALTHRDTIRDLGEYIRLVYKDFSKMLSNRKGKILSSILKQIDQGRKSVGFEPFIGNSFATKLCAIRIGSSRIPIVRLPSPTFQESVNKASASELFSSYLRLLKKKKEKALLINLQDAESLKSFARSEALRDLADLWSKTIQVIELGSEGDFYFQQGVFESRSEVEDFSQELIQYFSKKKKRLAALSKEESTQIVETIITTIYEGEKNLSVIERCRIIDFVTLLSVLKKICEEKPDQIFISCKDGLDATLPFIGEIACFLFMLHGGKPSKKEVTWLTFVELGLPLILRHRVIFEGPYTRFCSFASFMTELTQKFQGKAQEKLLRGIEQFLGISRKKISLEPFLE